MRITSGRQPLEVSRKKPQRFVRLTHALRFGPIHSLAGIRCSVLLGCVALMAPALALAENSQPVAQLHLTAPTDYQVFQRAALDRGTLVIEGQWSIPRRSIETPDRLEARVLPPGASADLESAWTAMPFDVRARGFRAELDAKPGGWYRVQVRLLRGGQSLASVDVAHVGIGEVFVIAGQSNSANYGEERQRLSSDQVTAFDGERWTLANDPQPGAGGTKGSFIPSFGDALSRKLKVPIGVVCIGVGSTSVREWLPPGRPMSMPPTTGLHCLVLTGGKFVSSGELFTRLVERLRQFPEGGVRAVLWHQGESDWHQPEGHTLPLSEFRNDLADLIASSRSSAGWNVPWFVAQASYGNPANLGSEEFRAQQESVTDGRTTLRGPNTDTLTGPLRENNGQGVHFSAEGLKRHGELWAELVGRWIEKENASRSAP
jgi:hypothetical protein